MNCRDAQSSFSLYLYGELDFAHEEALEYHLEQCSACQLGLAREKQWHTLTNAQVAEPPLDLLSACRQQLRPALAREAAPPRSIGNWWRWRNPFEFATHWSSQIALASFLVFVGFAAARWMDRGGSLPSSGGLNQMSLLNPANTLVRDIQTDNRGLIRIMVDQESAITGHIEDPNVRSLLLSGARQADAAVRFYSVQLLNQESKTRRADDLRQIFLDAARNDPNPAVRLEAIDGLRRFSGESDALETIKFVLEHDNNRGVRYQAIGILVPPDRPAPITPAMTQTIQDVLRSSPGDEYIQARCSQALHEAKLPIVY